MVENEDALSIYYLTQGQYVMGPNGPVDINHTAVHEAMRLYRIRNRRECFRKVLRLARWHLDRMGGGE